MENNNDIEIAKVKRRKSSNNNKVLHEKKNNISVPKANQRNSVKVDLHSSNNRLTLNKSTRKVIKSSGNQQNDSLPDSFESLKNTLININEIVIKQEADILEAVTGCQEPNNYHVYGKLPSGEKIYIFKCREFSSCGMRYFCPVNCREFSMRIKLAFEEDENTEDEEFEDSLININKDCKCPCLCCIRPDMDIIISENNEKLGKIEQAFSCCDPVFNIYDKNDNKIFYIEADCCQCGLMCRNNFMGKTDEANFFIYNINDYSNPIGNICKKAAKSMFSIADNYLVDFPTKATFEEKILLTIAGIMIDYQYFEKNTKSK